MDRAGTSLNPSPDRLLPESVGFLTVVGGPLGVKHCHVGGLGSACGRYPRVSNERAGGFSSRKNFLKDIIARRVGRVIETCVAGGTKILIDVATQL